MAPGIQPALSISIIIAKLKEIYPNAPVVGIGVGIGYIIGKFTERYS